MKPKIKIAFSWRQLADKAAPIFKLITPCPKESNMNRWYHSADVLFTDLKKQLY